ncbi:MAG: hypothetical protein Q8K26_02385, partial [Candidatus Gracilibacteria bacterium]|nr:hypothetical protein [Candidatus Gracilibacteria bacterium]
MKLQKYILSTLVAIIMVSGIIYAISYPVNPAGQTPGGTFSLRLANMIGSCPANTFLKGFDANFNRICVPSSGIYTGPAITSPSVPSGYPSTAPTGQYANGKMGTYFNNLRGICPGNKIIKGFATDGWKYCVDPTTPTVYTPHTSPISSGISWPATPGGQSVGGEFQNFFTNMFTICSGDKMVGSINSDGTLACVPPPGPFSVNAGKMVSCVWSNAITLYGMVDSNGNPFVRVTFGIHTGQGSPTDS